MKSGSKLFKEKGFFIKKEWVSFKKECINIGKKGDILNDNYRSVVKIFNSVKKV